jgi:hypothetical protein
VVIVLGIAKGRGQIQKFISEVHWFGSAATDPMEAMKDMGLGGSPATKNDIAKILAEMETYRAEKQATGEASPTDDAEQQRAAEAVADVLGDTSLQARAAADAMREGGGCKTPSPSCAQTPCPAPPRRQSAGAGSALSPEASTPSKRWRPTKPPSASNPQIS